MNTIELWYWRVTDPVSRRSYVTRYRMTQANARDFDPAAQRVEGSLERRVVRDDLPSINVQADDLRNQRPRIRDYGALAPFAPVTGAE